MLSGKALRQILDKMIGAESSGNEKARDAFDSQFGDLDGDLGRLSIR